MLRLIEIATGDILETLPDGSGWLTLPNGDRVSPAVAGWQGGGEPAVYRLESFEPEPPPEPEPPTRWQVSTYRVVRRIADAGKASEGRALLTADPEMEMRFLTVGHVWNDDIPLNEALPLIGLDPMVVLAMED